MILYQGSSMIDGRPIVAIATGLQSASSNIKTGDMVQTWIMPADVAPHVATRTGADRSVCGDCPHRPAAAGSCYVTVHHGPLSVFRAVGRGKYPTLDLTTGAGLSAFSGRSVRLGAWGDPAAVPAYVWRAITDHADAWTGYTHQWATCDQALQAWCMASVDTASDMKRAQAMGWRTFRTRLPGERLQERETICPASSEAGKRLTCSQCLACGGGSRRGSIAIIAHGSAGKVRGFVKGKRSGTFDTYRG